MDRAAARKEFVAIVGGPEAGIDLARAALLIACEEYPGLDVARQLARLDELAASAGASIGRAGANPFAVIDALNNRLFAELGFRGNHDDYFDPRNSFLNDVLDRRVGIPITLSLLYMEVAARVCFPLEGVALPGHFIVRHAVDGRDILIDPFHGGRILLPEDCRARVREMYGDRLRFQPRFLASVGKKKMLARLLTNLKNIYVKREDYPRALAVLERLVALDPDDPRHLRDRALAHLKLSLFGSAAEDLHAYLALYPAAPDASSIRRKITSIRRLTASLN